MNDRRSISPLQMRGLLHRQKNICPICGQVINLARGDKVHVDHVIPLALGGADTWDNMTATHDHCHVEVKTPLDRKDIARAKRLAKKMAEHAERMAAKGQPITEAKPRRKIASRALPGGRGDTLKKKLTGQTERRGP
ncbi:HNH endonuclease [Maritimibacter sp. DP1N21-5]|uniref:HNH endonuclease n=1 Tax=Maritimibacter sp. DP1N21-5 TaxID=2836867 RepID=UPI001C45745B|nr:HNH endonuclease [Maritimibacter sp. DP1N21-5]MBV7408725.1 HNH endonuclease [Maritimibacter sp. DP1N21-5]